MLLFTKNRINSMIKSNDNYLEVIDVKIKEKRINFKSTTKIKPTAYLVKEIDYKFHLMKKFCLL